MDKFSMMGLVAAVILAILAVYLVWGRMRPAEERDRMPSSLDAGVRVFSDPQSLVEDKKK